MDIVFIRDLQIETIIGIYDWERKIRQVISLDIEMATDIQKAANIDNIEADYLPDFAFPIVNPILVFKQIGGQFSGEWIPFRWPAS